MISNLFAIPLCYIHIPHSLDHHSAKVSSEFSRFNATFPHLIFINLLKNTFLPHGKKISHDYCYYPGNVGRWAIFFYSLAFTLLYVSIQIKQGLKAFEYFYLVCSHYQIHF